MSMKRPAFLRSAGLGLATLALLGLASPTQAAPVVYTVSGIATGNLGGTNFTNASFVITANADTNSIALSSPGVFSVQNLSTTFVITGVGSGTFLDRIASNSNQNLSRAGFGAIDADRAIIFVDGPAFSTYDLSTSIGPITGTTIGNPDFPFQTSAGALRIGTNRPTNFQAVVSAPSAVPEPSQTAALGLGGLALAGLTLKARKRKVSAAL